MALSALQNLFLAKRLLTLTDTEAAKQVPVTVQCVSTWKAEQPEFRAKYDSLHEDGIELARAILRQHLADAAITLAEGLKATERGRTDYATRIAAAEKILRSHRVIVDHRELTGKDGGAITVELTADDLRAAVQRARGERASDNDTDAGTV